MPSRPPSALIVASLAGLAGAVACLDWDALYAPVRSTDPLALWDFEGRLSQQAPTIPDKAPRLPEVTLVQDINNTGSNNATLENGFLRLGNGRMRPAYRASADLVQEMEKGAGFSFEGWLEIPQHRSGVVMLIGPNGRGGLGHLSVAVQAKEVEDELIITARTVGPAGDAGTGDIGQAALKLGEQPAGSSRTLYLVTTYDASSAVLTVYIDGEVADAWNGRDVDRRVAIWDDSYAGDWLLAFGSDARYGLEWPGKIALFAFYDRSLPQAEVRALYARGPNR